MTKMISALWLGLAVATVAIYVLPVPFQGTLLLACGVGHGRLLARFF